MMSGPIVRSGPRKQFTENWESVFGKKTKVNKKIKPKAAVEN